MSKQELFINGLVEKQDMVVLCTDLMKIFGANINLMRYLPMASDGLKPGERRILYAMNKNLGIDHKSNFTKNAQIVGQTLLYHPHGESPIAETIGRLGQPWNNLLPLIDKQGNYGSPMGDPIGSSRYIEARLTKYAYKCFFEDFKESISDMSPNFLDTMNEPNYLPSKYPHLLVCGSFGIGYGLVTGIPSYNFKEVCELTIRLIEDPSYENCTLYPDSPTGSDVVDDGQFEDISITGKGKYRMRGVIDIDTEQHALIVRSTPYLTTWNKIKAKMLLLNTTNSIGILDLDDFSDESGIHVVIYIKPEVSLEEIRNTIFKSTEMERVLPVDMKMIHNNMVVDYNIRKALYHWIKTRRSYKRRDLTSDILDLREREHILKILIFIFNKDNAERTINIIKDSKAKRDSIDKLVKVYGITSLQAEGIVEMKLGSFNEESRNRYKKELKEVVEEAERLEKITKSDKKIDKIIISELEEGIKLFGSPRRSKIIFVDGKKNVPDTDHLILTTNGGKIKKLPATINTVGAVPKDDSPNKIIKINNKKNLLLFDEKGKIFKVAISSIPSSELDSEGEDISKYANTTNRIVALIPMPEDVNPEKMPSLIFITKNSLIKKTSMSEFIDMKNELIAVSIKKGDSLEDVKMITETKTSTIMLYTNSGRATRLYLKDIAATGRASVGLKAIKLNDNERIIASNIVRGREKYIFVLTGKGYCKLLELSAFKPMTKKDEPIKIITLDSDDFISIMRSVTGTEGIDIYLMNSDIFRLELSKVKVMTKLSRAEKMVPVRRGDFIIDAKLI